MKKMQSDEYQGTDAGILIYEHLPEPVPEGYYKVLEK
jgi:hypothetical protein